MARKLTTIQRQVLQDARDHGVVYSGIANLGHQQWHKSTLISLEKKHMLCLKDEWWKTSAHPAYEITTLGRKALETTV